MSEILLVRHGETEWNVAEVFRGRLDIELDRAGMEQAELLGQYLSRRPIEAIYSSPLRRAVRTAGGIARRHTLEVNPEPGLTDFNYGRWQGMSHAEVKERYPELYRLWTHHPEKVRMPDGEDLDTVRARATAVIEKVAATHKGNVVIVSHRVVNKVLICALLGLDVSHFWNIRQDNCGITTFARENDRFVLTGHNDTSFLGQKYIPPASDF